ncbi:GNAT family N-acetyltransferase [Dinoroseobacter sp. S375]|uniref:GNAT family N-acetyltransferase n=1 Tax=Dinoroseobacter sp. S375 TaxID=3415136 RepID=UPI003C7E9469
MTHPPSGPPKPETPRADIVVRAGFPEAQRDRAAALYWQAFQGKLHRLMGPEAKALSFLRQVADPDFAISALGPDGRLLGVAGFKTAEGGFMGGEMADLRAVYGGLGALWRGLGLSVLERPVTPGILLMDGIMVEASARGQGIGRALLTAIKQTARSQGCRQVRLDVIDTNPRARALYEREGFVAGDTTDLGPFRALFGFRSATTMICPL